MVNFPEPGARIVDQEADTKKIFNSATGVFVDATCNKTVTISCLQQMYGALGYVPSDSVNNSIAIAGYLVVFSSILLAEHIVHILPGQLSKFTRPSIILC